MKTYVFIANATISVATRVEAESLEAAIEESKSRGMQGLCHQCASGDEDRVWSVGGELDCEPSGFELVDFFIAGETKATCEKMFPEAEKLFNEE
jgi:hypothetical protein